VLASLLWISSTLSQWRSQKKIISEESSISKVKKKSYGSVHPAYNPSFSACFFSRNSIFLSQQISQQYFSAGLSAQPNGAYDPNCTVFIYYLSVFFTGRYLDLDEPCLV
jgi:hypothetical protein